MRVFDGEYLLVKRDRPLVIRDTSSETEQVGYVTIEQMVNQMIISGERLMDYKRQAYDYPDGDFNPDDARPDPTLNVGFDFSDYSFYQSELAKKLSEARKVQRGSEGKTSEVVPPSSNDAVSE